MQTDSPSSDSKPIPKGQKVKFAIPDNWNPPEQPDPSKDIDLVCSFRVEDGALCMTKLGDHPMAGYGDESDKSQNQKPETKPDYSSMVPAEDAGPMGGMRGMGGSY